MKMMSRTIMMSAMGVTLISAKAPGWLSPDWLFTSHLPRVKRTVTVSSTGTAVSFR